MDAATLRRKVLAADADAIGEARQAGEEGVAVLVELTRHDDREVRLVAARALQETGGAGAVDAGLALVGDPDVQVAFAGAIIVRRHGAADAAPRLLEAFDRTAYAMLRRELALIAARFAGAVDPAPWRERWWAVSQPDVREGLLVAVARMGDAEARSEFAARLAAVTWDDAKRWIDHARLIAQPWVLPPLESLLDNHESADRHYRGDRVVLDLSIADLAAEAIAEISGAGRP